MLVAFVAMFKGMDMYKKAETSSNDAKKYTYAYTRKFYFFRNGSVDIDYNNITKLIDSNLDFESIATLDNGKSYRFYIYMKYKDLKVDFSWGSDSKLNENNGVPSVIVGKKIFEDRYKKDGNYYVKINTNDYRIVGVLESKKSDYLDDLIITTYNSLAYSDRKQLDEEMFVDARLSSDKPTADDFMTIQNYIKETLGDSVEVEEVSIHSEQTSDDNFLMPVIAMFVFCIFNCIIAAEFYVYEREEEIALRKIYGYSNEMIFKVTFFDVLKLSSLCAVLGFLLQFIINVVTDGFARAINEISIEYLALSIFIVLISTLVIILVPILKTMKNTASEMLRGYL